MENISKRRAALVPAPIPQSDNSGYFSQSFDYGRKIDKNSPVLFIPQK
ncbi:MAG: hypothetical protein FWE67_02545 [Planctomycetaceae bacterium]|nr:hypothetical protein [Planctomycetaceae bacterium]